MLYLSLIQHVIIVIVMWLSELISVLREEECLQSSLLPYLQASIMAITCTKTTKHHTLFSSLVNNTLLVYTLSHISVKKDVCLFISSSYIPMLLHLF